MAITLEGNWKSGRAYDLPYDFEYSFGHSRALRVTIHSRILEVKWENFFYQLRIQV